MVSEFYVYQDDLGSNDQITQREADELTLRQSYAIIETLSDKFPHISFKVGIEKNVGLDQKKEDEIEALAEQYRENFDLKSAMVDIICERTFKVFQNSHDDLFIFVFDFEEEVIWGLGNIRTTHNNFKITYYITSLISCSDNPLVDWENWGYSNPESHYNALLNEDGVEVIAVGNVNGGYQSFPDKMSEAVKKDIEF